MQNVQNSFTVENLVAKYRDYVNEHCIQDSYDDSYQDKDGKWHIIEGSAPIYSSSDAIEQLLITLYKHVAGNNADTEILAALSKSSDNYFSDALTEEEFSFLCDKFEDVVEFSFSYLKENNGRMMYFVPTQMIDIIRANTTTLKNDTTIFVADARNGDISSLFPECIIKGYTSHKDTWMDEEVWALVQIRLFAQGMKSQIQKSHTGCISESYIEDVDLVIMGTSYHSSFADAEVLYRGLKPGARMILFMDEREAATAKGDTYNIRKAAVTDCSIQKIISFEYKDAELDVMRNKIALIIEKSSHTVVHIENNITGTFFEIPTSSLDCELLWPSFYKTTRPISGIPLTDIVSFIDLTNREVIKDDSRDWVLPEEVKSMPVAVPAKMAKEYKDANLLAQDLDLAGSPLFDDNWKFWIRSLKEPCVLLYGNKEKTVVGYIRELPESGMATLDTIVCLVPKDGIDVRYVAALLLTPIVKEQIESICQGAINDYTFPLVMGKVIVPNHSDKERVDFLSEANYDAISSLRTGLEATYKEKYDAMKADYINGVRMRKHDMRPHLRQLASSERLMIHYIDNCTDLEELKRHMRNQLYFTHEALASLSTIVDHLANEEMFGKPELLNLDKLLEGIEVNHDDSEGFAIKYDCDRESFNRAGFAIPDVIRQWEEAREQGADMKKIIQSLANENLPLFVKMASVDFQRLVTNIIDNARHHGFTDNTRTDYYIGIDLSYNSDREMYQIDFSNNGNPLPIGMTKERFGIPGEKAGESGRTGNGGHIIKAIVSHYGGDFDLLSKDGITIIRIYLPKNN